MFALLIAIFGILLFFSGKKVGALLLFFFFLTNGFQIVPLELFESSFGLSKGYDYSIVMIIGIFLLDVLTLRFNPQSVRLLFPRVTWLFPIFFVVTILYSWVVLGIGIGEVIRSARPFLLFLSPLLFLRLNQEESDRIHRVLLLITLLLSILFVLQNVFHTPLLNGYAGGGEGSLFGVPMKRYYNTPFFVAYFIYYVVYVKGLKSLAHIVQLGVLLLPILFSLHRSHIVAVALVFAAGTYLRNGVSWKSAKRVILALLLIIPLIGVLEDLLSDTSTLRDITNLATGSFTESMHPDSFGDETMMFRFAHLYERALSLLDSPKSMILGMGWMTEGSPYVQANFDYMFGLRDETGQLSQIDTSDIAWSLMIIRLGFVGTLLYLFFIAYFFYTIYRRGSMNLRMVNSSYFLLLLILSFTGIDIFLPATFALSLLDYSIVKSNHTDL